MNNTSVIFGLVAAPSKTAQILKVISDPEKKVVVVLFSDGTKEVVKCSKEDEFDVYVGVAIAEARHKYRTTSRFHRKVDRVLITLKTKTKKVKKAQTGRVVPGQEPKSKNYKKGGK